VNEVNETNYFGFCNIHQKRLYRMFTLYMVCVVGSFVVKSVDANSGVTKLTRVSTPDFGLFIRIFIQCVRFMWDLSTAVLTDIFHTCSAAVGKAGYPFEVSDIYIYIYIYIYIRNIVL
jgi:hypothetical protein